MFSFIARRTAGMVPMLVIVSIISFLFVHLTPGDPIRILYGNELDAATYELLKEKEGFNDPLYVQYFRYVGSVVLDGDFGTSYRTKANVSDEIFRRFSYTLLLTFASMIWAVIIGLFVGIVSAVKRNSWMDRIGMVSAITALSVPEFWFGLMLMQIFAVQLGWFPTSGSGTFRHLILPSLTLGLGVAAIIARFTRSSILEVLREDFVRTAKAKGQKEWTIVLTHVLRSALIPVVTMTGLQFGFLLGGAVVVEQVFSWPGLGSYLIDSILTRDYPVIQALIMLFSVQFLVVNLIVDISYGLLNPQIRYE
ncbi:nickel ABC transporter permease [Brevibacillus choshinensis]|uniref:Glutathione transport system permease protein GsiC n=1 Tax=Brevibacillus choshinensis TaxID=54911 RepID=A0ABR5N847_BRECH|nr:nickel ABC transporter permease [Brevibacillus choshinensis]KQL46818.1 glutathione ABC transporter permease [Brevibacillus choshinensis]MED4583578.1 ABC transporter permease subunit [Brevibacillus choshinensis]MED4751710.1 ABC transporter permease subunit [Brevibacillus choshinensis]MED4780051.1 ABC transporter permease subunit [Brevibacillus choshinensis]